MKTTGGRSFDIIMKVLQAVSIVFMAVMLVVIFKNQYQPRKCLCQENDRQEASKAVIDEK